MRVLFLFCFLQRGRGVGTPPFGREAAAPEFGGRLRHQPLYDVGAQSQERHGPADAGAARGDRGERAPLGRDGRRRRRRRRPRSGLVAAVAAAAAGRRPPIAVAGLDVGGGDGCSRITSV